MVPAFDHIVVGAGLSGLLLARSLLQQATASNHDSLRLLVVDPRPVDSQPVTFAFWTRGPTVLDRWQIGSWTQLRVVAHDGQVHTVGLDDWRYVAISWARARAELVETLAADPRVTFAGRRVQTIRDGADAAQVHLGDTWIPGSWVFDSRPRARPASPPPGAAQAQPPASEMVQVFRGTWVRTAQPVIDTAAATLLDFSADDHEDLGFAYVLPTSSHTAMVMGVRMAAVATDPDPLPAVARVVGTSRWHPMARESGITALPVSSPRQEGRRVLAIGLRGGRARPATGYAVTRIISDTESICASLSRHGHPFDLPPDPRWQQQLDRIWLRAVARERAALEPAFLSLFTDAPIGSVLRFLEGDARPADIAKVIRCLPPRPFLRALVS